MSIAIVSNNNNHGVCLGFLLEIMKDYNITLFITQMGDEYKWIEYYKTLYNFETIYNLNINVNNYKKVIKLTSSDECLYNEDTISILHLQSIKHINNNSKKFISLSPYINDVNISYMFPIYKPKIINNNNNKKIVTFIGYYMNSNIDLDTDFFIKNNLEYKFIFITWGDNKYDNLNKHNNVVVLHSVNTNKLVEIINNSKFILSKKYINYDRYSGQLGLAMSFEKPLIIDFKTANSYNLPGFIFNKNYNEIGKLDTITDETYNSIVESIKIFNNDTLQKNKQTINNLLI